MVVFADTVALQHTGEYMFCFMLLVMGDKLPFHHIIIIQKHFTIKSLDMKGK